MTKKKFKEQKKNKKLKNNNKNKNNKKKKIKKNISITKKKKSNKTRSNKLPDKKINKKSSKSFLLKKFHIVQHAAYHSSYADMEKIQTLVLKSYMILHQQKSLNIILNSKNKILLPLRNK